MNENAATSYLPFHAINEFMRDDFRMDIIRKTLIGLPSLPAEFREPIDRITRRIVQVPGFRNSAKAPAGMRFKPSAESFKTNPDFAGSIINAWASLQPDLMKQVSDLLIERNWELPSGSILQDRAPGFLPTWPNGESFETVQQAFQEKYSNSEVSPDDISLMVVWLSGSLPYQNTSDQDDPKDQ